MSQPSVPRVGQPKAMPQKLTVPGPNSWALSATQGDPKKLPQPAQVTNREKYETEPMPRTPGKPSDDGRLAVPKNRGYIHPATPLVYTNHNSQTPKSRAATDPIIPQPLFTGKPGGIAQLRKKISTSKTNVNIIQEDDGKQLPSLSPVLSVKASQVLGVWPVPDNTRRTPPASAPPSTSTPDPYRISSDDQSTRSVSPSRQIQSTPVLTYRYLRENDQPTPDLGHSSLATAADDEAQKQILENPENLIMSCGMVNPNRMGTYGRVGGAEYVDGHEDQRVASYVGMIENAESVNQMIPKQNSDTSQECDSGVLLQPASYSPSNYDGVWESDPHVGYSLAPFSPARSYHPRNPEMHMRDSSQGSGTTVPVVLRDYYLPPSRLSVYPPSTSSVNSWAPNSQGVLGNSFAATEPQTPADKRPQYPNQNAINAAPTPPRSHPEFQPSKPMPASLSQLELALHHHIESCFGSLSRLVTDKHDRIMDQIIRRLENLEEIIGKGQKSGKGDIRDMKKDIGILKVDVKDVLKGSNEVKNLIKALDHKIGTLEKTVKEDGSKCQHVTADVNRNEPEKPAVQQRLPVHRRTESAHAPGNPEQLQRYQSGTSHSSSPRHQSGNSSKGRRSNTLSGEGRSSAGGSSRREYFAELGAARSPVPDLREHPAYSSGQQGYGQASDSNDMPGGMGGSDAALFQAPSFSEGWYQRVYGQR